MSTCSSAARRHAGGGSRHPLARRFHDIKLALNVGGRCVDGSAMSRSNIYRDRGGIKTSKTGQAATNDRNQQWFAQEAARKATKIGRLPEVSRAALRRPEAPATFSSIAVRILGKNLLPPVGTNGPIWTFLGEAPLTCTECPDALRIAVSSIGDAVVLCANCLEAWPLADYDEATIQAVREFVAAGGRARRAVDTADQGKVELGNKKEILRALVARRATPPVRRRVAKQAVQTSRRCRECLKVKPLTSFPSSGGFRCVACGGQERGTSVVALRGGLPGLGKR